MNIFLVIIMVIAIAFFVWQVALLIRDVVKKVKSKKANSTNNSAVNDTANNNKEGE